jgi:hypothetical protein
MFDIPENASESDRLLLSNLFSQIRKYKINAIDNDSSFRFIRDNINEEAYILIQKFTERFGGIITGSFVLKGYGLIKRNISDVDLLVTQSQYDVIANDFVVLSHHYTTGSAKFIRYHNYPIDLFIISDEDYEKRGRHIENSLYFDNPFKIVEHKLKYTDPYGERSKDWWDFNDITKCLETGVYHTQKNDIGDKKKWYDKLTFWK